MRRLALLLLVLASAACGKDANRLYGSVSQIYDLDFDRVRISRVADQVSIAYLRDETKVAKLTVVVGDLANMAGNDIDLMEIVKGLPRGTMQRVEQTTTDFTLQVGKVHFNQEPTVGTELSGSFHTTLADPAPGRTLNGEFQAKVEEVELP
jgi:hypothetical protein